MILVTSASGHVGTAIVAALIQAGLPVRAFVHSEQGKAQLNAVGVQDIVVGDLLDPISLGAAFQGITQVFHIGPPEHPRELAIGQAMTDLAQEHGVSQFVYFSVLQPFISSLRHHWNKLLTQEYLVDSGVPYTVLHPTMFMQSPQRAIQSGVMAAPYSPDQPMSVVALDDVAEVAVKVLSEKSHLRASYDLVGGEPLSVRQMAEIVSKVVGKPIEVQQVVLETVTARMPRSTPVEAYGSDSLERMFLYYSRHGLTGSANVLGWVLGRPPTSYEAFVRKNLGH
ncbi:NAD-dependent epimerase/dehydratase family protein [Deinococcus sp. Arct2-2]|uniref:SDR family oxidoreductase n=1 Tax=Deinococcus sp. Arct2-2 TaxID=2568653 RepID=UPI0010A3E4E5|nr:NmrA family NAD(P)-binding protein [Deinococcus sp. Arct2-2]THF69702.1 NAD-dependent epimerase/dehydratase family protein [Deinococcus sp. Arct2-2]